MRKHSPVAIISAVLVTASLAVVSAGEAQTATPSPAQTTREARVSELIQQAAAQVASQQERATIELKLDDAVQMALEQNLEIAVERLNPLTYDLVARRIAGRIPADVDLDRWAEPDRPASHQSARRDPGGADHPIDVQRWVLSVAALVGR